MHISNNLNFCSYFLNEEGGLEKENQDIGLWGIRRARYLWYNDPKIYAGLIATGQAHEYYFSVNKKATKEYDKVLKQYIKDRRIKSIRNKENKRAEMDKAISDAEDVVYEKYILIKWEGDTY